MSKKENVKKIKKYIDEILNTKSSLSAKRPLKQDKLRELAKTEPWKSIWACSKSEGKCLR